MSGKYSALTEALRVTAARGQDTVELGFAEVADLVGGLPPSAQVRQWWANSSQVQALAWRAAGFHVQQVYLDRRRVRFARGERGASYADGGRVPASAPVPRTVAGVARKPIGEQVDVRVSLRWLDGGPVTLDAGRKPTFGWLEDVPGIYRMTLDGGATRTRPRVYIGETQNLRRQLSGNYRNPGGGQQTNLRISELLRGHLAAGGTVTLAVATTARVWLSGIEGQLDLTHRTGRLLAENAALVLAHAAGDAEIVNL